jgi:hypothetical protein
MARFLKHLEGVVNIVKALSMHTRPERWNTSATGSSLQDFFNVEELTHSRAIQG